MAIEPVDRWWRQNCGMLFSRFGIGFQNETAPPATAEGNENRLLAREDFLEGLRLLTEPIFANIASTKPGSTVVLEQTPEHVRHGEMILSLFPEAHFLHVIRDPRSVFSSLTKAVQTWASPNAFPTNAVERARFWCSDVTAGRTIAQMTHRYHEIRYEDLLENGPTKLERAFAWLGIPTERAFCENAVEACKLDNLKKGRSAPVGFFRKGTATGWRDEISRSELEVVEYVCGDLMVDLGYERALPERRGRPLAVKLHESRWLRRCLEAAYHLGVRRRRSSFS